MSAPDDVWRARYLELERQFEYALMQVAAFWPTPAQIGTSTAPKPRIRKLFLESPQSRRVTCVCDGVNLDFRFTVNVPGAPDVQTEFSRANSFIVPENIREAVIHAEARSHEARVTARSKLTVQL